MREIVEAIAGEFARYKALGEGALRQVEEQHLSAAGPNKGNSLAVIVWHISGNLSSRFTDFLTSDGEKPWRHRDEEFSSRQVSRAELTSKWDAGWQVLQNTLSSLTDDDLGATVQLRGQPIPVREALLRSLAHISYHVGQIVYLGKALRGDSWTYLSIPPGGSAAYNANPTGERARQHAARLTSSTTSEGQD